LTCNIPPGAPSGTCGTNAPPPDGGVGGTCSLAGQTCSATQPCCSPYSCLSPATGTACAAGQVCSCYLPPG
jgi:hypothetical protein